MTQTWWLSFSDPDKPKGQQFLGVIIVDVDDADVARAAPRATALRASHGLPPLTDPRDQQMAAAIDKTHRHGCNPGGEVLALPIDIPDGVEAPRLRLLTKPELETLGAVSDRRHP